ncbi:hypothetical protein GZL_05903 [Streptomyces sp. 769]|nr:hypothetical protein GZL_05903 [Streptomyces sp. 769]
MRCHPEPTSEVLRAWFEGVGPVLPVRAAADPERGVAESRAALPAARERARVPVDAFLDHIAAAGPNDGTTSHMSA